MKLFIFDEDGTQYEFKNINFIDIDKNDNGLYSIKLHTSEGEFFRISNAVAIFKEINNQKFDNNLEIKIKNTKKPLLLPYSNASIKFKESTYIDCDIDTYELTYFFKYINYSSFSNNKELDKKPIYEKGYFVFNDGTLLTINDIVKYEKIENKKSDFQGYIIHSKKRVYAINNCICHIFYNNSKNINKNSILNLVVNGNHIKLEGIDRTDIEFYFKDNKNKLSYEINNSKIDINLSYYYRHLSSVWFSKKDNSVINLQSNFNKSKKSHILSL